MEKTLKQVEWYTTLITVKQLKLLYIPTVHTIATKREMHNWDIKLL